MALPERPYFLPVMKRHVIIAANVLLFHIAALWALQTGLLRRAVEIIVPAEILSEFIEPAPPKAEPAPPAARLQPVPAPAPTPIVRPAPPQPPAEPAPAANAPLVAPAPIAPAPGVAPATAAATPAAAPPGPPKVELPSSDAQYLQNPKPPYPAMSKRLGEQGKVVVRVLIGVDGAAQKAEIQQSSGFERLDQAALGTVLRWRYVPGKRGGMPEAMWFNVPIHFVLE